MGPGPLPIDDPRAPKFWQAEVTGRLEGPIMRYLQSEPVSLDDIRLIRLYLQQWIDSPVWEMGPEMDAAAKEKLAYLRQGARLIKNRPDIDAWIEAALDIGIDPL
jgi:hypothetical protein